MSNNSIAGTAEKFVSEKPFIIDCLRHGLVNFSALARQIIREEKLSERDFGAIVVALRRLSEKTRPGKESQGRILRLLKGSKLEVKNRISVVFLDSKISMSSLAKLVNEIAEEEETLHMIHGSKSFSIITTSTAATKIAETFRYNLIQEKKGLVEIILRTSEEIEGTPGVMAFLYSRFSENGINIVETMSSWTDTLFVIDEKDLPKAMNALKF
ncbi:MAG: ACT domain-containing protein [Candidatus Diapherotrites archaeon]